MRGDNIKMNYRRYFLTTLLLVISLFLIFQPAGAEFIAEEQDINFKLHNEFRHADRPSASAPYGPEIDAWVQSTLLDYKSGSVLGDMFGIEANLYNAGKLKANPDKATRFYLGGDDLHSSFSVAGAALTLDFGENLNLYGVYSEAYTGGYYTEWTDYSNYVTGEDEPKYTIGAVVDKEERKYTFGYDYQRHLQSVFWNS